MTDINTTIEDLAKSNEAFQTEMKNRFEQLEKKGSVDPLTEEKLNKINETLGTLQTEVTNFQKKANRPEHTEGSVEEKSYRGAFGTYARKGEKAMDDTEYKTLVTSNTTGANGGFAIPKVIDAAVMERVVQLNPIRALSTVVQTSTTDYRTLINNKGIVSGWVGETDARAATDTSVLAEIKPIYGELYANPQATQTILDDAFFDVEAWLANDIAEEFARAEGAAFVSGDGTNKPKGFLAGTTALTADATRAYGTIQHILSGVANALPTSFAVYYNLVYSMKSELRSEASFLGNASVHAAVRSMVDGEGRPLWQPSLVAGEPATFLGFAFNEVQDMADVTAGALPLAFANLKRGYLIADRVGIRTLRDPFTNKPYVGFYTTKRVGGIIADSEAIKVLKISPAS